MTFISQMCLYFKKRDRGPSEGEDLVFKSLKQPVLDSHVKQDVNMCCLKRNQQHLAIRIFLFTSIYKLYK